MDPKIVIEGIEEVIKRDLLKHRELLKQTKLELDAYKRTRSHEIKRKKHYSGLIGGGKYNDDALRRSMKDIAINIRHLTDKIRLSDQKLDHHRLIVDTLSEQLKSQDEGLDYLAKWRREHGAER